MIERILEDIDSKGFSYVESFLTEASLREISEFFESHKNEFKPALIGPAQSKQRNENVRGDHTFWLDPLDPPLEFRPLIKFLDELREKINARFFLGLKQFECHLAYYPQGTFYKKHSDRFEVNSSRSLSFVFYLNENWTPADGGELLLYDKNDNSLETIRPMPGSFICFLSEDFPHEVKSALRERRSLTGWMHTKIIY